MNDNHYTEPSPWTPPTMQDMVQEIEEIELKGARINLLIVLQLRLVKMHLSEFDPKYRNSNGDKIPFLPKSHLPRLPMLGPWYESPDAVFPRSLMMAYERGYYMRRIGFSYWDMIILLYSLEIYRRLVGMVELNPPGMTVWASPPGIVFRRR